MFHASMSFDLGEDVNALRDMVHDWAQTRVKPMAAQIDRDNLFPAALWREMGELGLLGITVDEAYGGAGMSYLAHTIAVEEIARASASVSFSVESAVICSCAAVSGSAALEAARVSLAWVSAAISWRKRSC